ncbi:MAG: diaminopimelate epimerase [Prolixibacteraceae bacterium]|nr:diaminopimelate epimerase [Prolixibacteraceae bacterium]
MQFSKMHGLGNDFIFLENLENQEMNYPEMAAKWCHRQLGIGADGLVIVLHSEQADLRMRIINADGSEANMCGNAIRCFARYAYERKLVQSAAFSIETFAGIMVPEVIIRNGKVEAVRVNMGKPDILRANIPMLGDETAAINVMLPIENKEINITSLLMGVPHTMIFVEEAEAIDLKTIGPMIEKHSYFPKGTNVNFVEVVNSDRIKIRTWERGAGATLACGTGSCASVVASILNEHTNRTVTVELQHGELLIEWSEDGTVFMTGPAEEVFSGNFIH